MPLQPAAFFRLEGPLVSRPATVAAAWLAANSQEIGLRLTRLAAVGLSVPARLGADPAVAARMAWMGLRGMSRDRLEILGEEYVEEHLAHAIRPAGERLLAAARREGRRPVLVSDHLEVIAQPMAERLGVDLVVANRMEIRKGRATGRLEDPVVGRLGGAWLKQLAATHELDLSRSAAYGATDVDVALLSSVALPCAVFPDRGLRAAARDLDWPVVEA